MQRITRNHLVYSLDKKHPPVLNINPGEIKIACIDYNPIGDSEITPDYYYLTTHKIIEKPWRILKSYSCPDDIQRT